MTNDQASAIFAATALKDSKRRAAGNALHEIVLAVDRASRAGRMVTGPVAKRGARSHLAWRKHLAATYRLQSILHATAACRFFALTT